MSLKTCGSLKDKTASYPLPQEMAYTKIKSIGCSTNRMKASSRTMTILDYKMLATLLYLAYEELEEVSGKGRWHEIDGKQILEVFTLHAGTKDLNRLWESFIRIGSFVVEYQRTDSDFRYEGITSLINIEKVTELNSDKRAMFRFQFPQALVPIFLDPKLFAILELSLILEMKSKYAIVLYQMLVPCAKMKYKKSVKGTVDEWKEWLKIPHSEKKSSAWVRFATFKQTVLDSAIEELNSKSDITGFVTTYTLHRRGRGGAVKEIEFNVKNILKPEITSSLNDTNQSEERPNKQEVLSSPEAYELIVYFEKVRNKVSIKTNAISAKDLAKAESFLEGVDSLAQAKEIVDTICSFENKPDFFGGLFTHKSRAIGILETRKKAQEIRIENQQKKQILELKHNKVKEAYKEEWNRYYQKLTDIEKRKIEQGIVEDLPPLIKAYFKEKRESISAEEIRQDVLYRWWLETEKKLSQNKINNVAV